jgi:hypothetical protein
MTNSQETQIGHITVQSEGNYENNGADRVKHSGFDDHENAGIIDAIIFVFLHDLPHQASHEKQAIRHENGIDHAEPNFDAEVGKLNIDSVPYDAGTRLD